MFSILKLLFPYRVVKLQGGGFQVEFRFFFWWMTSGVHDFGLLFGTEEEAKEFIHGFDGVKQVVYSE